MKKLTLVFVALILAWHWSENYWDSVHVTKWVVLLMCLGICLAWRVASKTSLALFPILVSSIVGPIYVIGWRLGWNGGPPFLVRIVWLDGAIKSGNNTAVSEALDKLYAVGIQDAYASGCGYTLIAFLLLAYLVSEIRWKTVRHLLDAFGWAGFATSLVLIYSGIFHEPNNFNVPFLDNPSMAGCFVAVTVPLQLSVFRGFV